MYLRKNIQVWLILFLVLISLLSCKQNEETKPKLYYEKHLVSDKPNKNPTLILFHGYGSNEKDLLPLGKGLNENYNVISVRAPITLSEDKYAWYPLNLNPGKTKYQFEDVKSVKSEMVAFIKAIKQSLDLNGETYIGGFSQGAIMSLYIGLTETDLVDGVIVLSGHLYDEMKSEIDFKDKFPKIFLSHGYHDRVLDFGLLEKNVAYLEGNGIAIDQKYYDAAHSISQDNFEDLKAWLR